MLKPTTKVQFSIALLLLISVAYVSCQLVGGLHDEKPADEEVKGVLNKVHKDVERMAKSEYKSLEPLSYRKQIVAGANYFIKALATDTTGAKSHVHLRVYKPFRGPMELSGLRTNQDASSPLEYF